MPVRRIVSSLLALALLAIGVGPVGSAVAAGSRAKVTVSARSSAPSARLGRYVTISGKATGARVGSVVRIQQRAGSTWSTVAQGKVRRNHTYAVKVRLTQPSSTRFRAVTVADSKHRAGRSKVITVGVTLRPGYKQLAVVTSALHTGTARLTYQDVLRATGGTPPYSWSATSVPTGLRVSRDGIVSGKPAATGTKVLAVKVTDADGVVRTRSVSLSVPSALPAACATSCSTVVPNTRTVQVAANQVGAVSRDVSGAPVQILLTGIAPQVGDVLVIAPGAQAPSGMTVAVLATTHNADGTWTVDVVRGGPADAYAKGLVVSGSAGSTTTLGAVRPLTTPDITAARTAAGAGRTGAKKGSPTITSSTVQASSASLTCDDPSVSSELHGLSVHPTFTPQIAALWEHPIFGGGGIYVGTGGLQLFQTDLDGSLAVDMGITVSGSATCTLDLPSVVTTVPAGNLGAVIMQLNPSITFKVDGKIDIRTTVTMTCGLEYRWSEGHESRISYCRRSITPLQLSADSGIDATLTGKLAASVTLDDLVGLDGDITAAIHAGYHPADHPLAQVDGKIAFELGACLACFWDGSPARVTLAAGTVWSGVLASYDRSVTPVPATSPPVILAAPLPRGTVGQPYSTRLRTADNREGTWSVTSGNLPAGLTLVGDTMSGRPTAAGSSSFTISFTDVRSRSASRSFSVLVVASGGTGGGAVQDLGYCRDNVFAPNDDASTGAVPLPFSANFLGTTYDSLYISNNGYVTFDYGTSTYTPVPLDDAVSQPIIAPFFADVDTRDPGSGYVTYGSSPDGSTLCVNWVDVGYYYEHAEKLNSFQLLLKARPDAGQGAFDVTFNYGRIGWETGDASGGVGGVGGTVARAGFSVGDRLPGSAVELAGSGVSGALLDGGADALTSGSHNSSVPGRYVWPIRA